LELGDVSELRKLELTQDHFKFPEQQEEGPFAENPSLEAVLRALSAI